MTDREEQLLKLQKKRLELERNCTDPEQWAALADEYIAIGAYNNAGVCQERAEYYKGVRFAEGLASDAL